MKTQTHATRSYINPFNGSCAALVYLTVITPAAGRGSVLEHCVQSADVYGRCDCESFETIEEARECWARLESELKRNGFQALDF